MILGIMEGYGRVKIDTEGKLVVIRKAPALCDPPP